MCYACYTMTMHTVSHRELRNDSGKVLDRVKRGETIGVTNHGELAAVLTPPHVEAVDRLQAAGRIRLARSDMPFGVAKRVEAEVSTAAALDDVRGDR
jgi:prevent-host-death family protein